MVRSLLATNWTLNHCHRDSIHSRMIIERGAIEFFIELGLEPEGRAPRRHARLAKRGAELVGEVVQYEDTYRLCYLRDPEGILLGSPKSLGSQGVWASSGFVQLAELDRSAERFWNQIYN